MDATQSNNHSIYGIIPALSSQNQMHIDLLDKQKTRPVEASTTFVGQLQSSSEKTYADLQPVASSTTAVALFQASVEDRAVLYNDTMMYQTEQPVHAGEFVDEYGEPLLYTNEENSTKLLDDYAVADAPLEHDTLAGSPQPFGIKSEPYDSGDSNCGGNLPYKLLDDMEREREVPHNFRMSEIKTEVAPASEELEGEEMARNCFESPAQKKNESQKTSLANAASVHGLYELSYPSFDATMAKEKAHRSAVYTFRFFLYLLTTPDSGLSGLVTWMDFQKPTDQPTKHALFRVDDKMKVVQYWSNGSKGNCETTMRNTWGNLTTRMRYARGEKNYGYFSSVIDIQSEEECKSRCPRKRMFRFGQKVKQYLAEIKHNPERVNSELEKQLHGFPDQLFVDQFSKKNLEK